MDRSLTAVKWILLASLLVNAAFAGFVFSQVTGHRGFGFGGPPPSMMREMARPRQDVPEATRKILNDAFASEKGDMEEALKAFVETRRKTMQLLRAEKLDAPALEAAMADMRAKTTAAQEIYHRVIMKAAPQLSPQERVLLARVLNAAPQRYGAEQVLNAPGPGPSGQRPGEFRPGQRPGEFRPGQRGGEGGPSPGEGGGPPAGERPPTDAPKP